MTSMCRSITIAIPIATGIVPGSGGAELGSHEARAKEIFKQLVEINTTHSVGDTTKAAEAMAARFKAAGFSMDNARRASARTVGGAAAVEVAVLLGEHERVHRPVLALRFDDVEVREQDHRPLRAGAAIAHDEVALLRRRSEHAHVGIRKASRLEPRGHRLRSLRRVANGVRRVDLDELLEDLLRARLRAIPFAPPGPGTMPLRSEWRS